MIEFINCKFYNIEANVVFCILMHVASAVGVAMIWRGVPVDAIVMMLAMLPVALLLRWGIKNLGMETH